MSNFNFIAPYYDLIVRVVFGKSLWKYQQYFLEQVKTGHSVLILGGGTGTILDWLPAGCQITFLEKSSRMIERAKKHRDMTFIKADFLEYTSDQKFDRIICPFFLDCFNAVNLEKAIIKCHSLLNTNGKLLVTDFYNQPTVWSRLKLWTMHLFFRVVSRLEARNLQDIHKTIQLNGFGCEAHSQFPKHGVFSAVYAALRA